MKIDVIMACGPNAESYTEFVIDNFLALASKENELNFILAEHKCNVQYLGTHPRIKKIVSMPDDVPKSQHSASEAHARSVNVCMQYVDTDLVLITDYDIAFLTHKWDENMVKQFSDPSVGIVGPEYEFYRPSNKYKNFPTVIMSMMKTSLIRDLNINFRPRHDRVNILTQEQADLYEVPLGSFIYPDTGIELIEKLKPNGIKGIPLRFESKGHLSLGSQFSAFGVTVNHVKSGSVQKQATIDTWKKSIYDFTHIESVK